ncbi:MAG TPA: diguanylate cyclase [Solimonas sp.]|nr:diguanylate cyclase [Solimonas sp.]
MTKALPRPKILVVDDTPANLIAMRRLLARADAEVVEASSGNEALARTLDEEFAVILLDVNMPEMDGFEVAQFLSQEEHTRNTPIIFVTAAYADDLNRLKGYQFGAVDYIAKPINDIILQSKVRFFLDLYRSRSELRSTLESLFELNNRLRQEIEERHKAEERVRYQATHDPLTELPNRALFMDRLQTALERARRSGQPCALLYVDIDGFKTVNDTHGHPAGDLLLEHISRRLRDRLRKSDTVARLGGDEFAVILEEQIEAPEAAVTAGSELCLLLRPPYELRAGLTIEVSASVGVAFYPLHGAGAADEREAFIHAADKAMYRAKHLGKNQCVLAATTARTG